MALADFVRACYSSGGGAATFSVAPTAGNLLLAWVSWYGPTANSVTVTGVTDTAGNTYQAAEAARVCAHATDTYIAQQLWYAYNCASASPHAVTATLSGAVANSNLAAMEFSGVVADVDPLVSIDGRTNAGGPSDYQFVLGTASPSQGGDLIVSGIWSGSTYPVRWSNPNGCRDYIDSSPYRLMHGRAAGDVAVDIDAVFHVGTAEGLSCFIAVFKAVEGWAWTDTAGWLNQTFSAPLGVTFEDYYWEINYHGYPSTAYPRLREVYGMEVYSGVLETERVEHDVQSSTAIFSVYGGVRYSGYGDPCPVAAGHFVEVDCNFVDVGIGTYPGSQVMIGWETDTTWMNNIHLGLDNATSPYDGTLLAWVSVSDGMGADPIYISPNVGETGALIKTAAELIALGNITIRIEWQYATLTGGVPNNDGWIKVVVGGVTWFNIPNLPIYFHGYPFQLCAPDNTWNAVMLGYWSTWGDFTRVQAGVLETWVDIADFVEQQIASTAYPSGRARVVCEAWSRE